MKKVLFLLLTSIFVSCTVNVTDHDNSKESDYCFADYYCSYYDISGHLKSGYFCFEEIEPNMTCK